MKSAHVRKLRRAQIKSDRYIVQDLRRNIKTMKQSLYELTGDYLRLMDMLYDEDVYDDNLTAACDAIEAQIEDKADGYAKIIKSMEATVAGLKSEEKRLKERRAALESRQKLLKENLEGSMRATGKTKFKTDLFSFGIQKNPASVKIDDPEGFIKRCQEAGRDDLLKFREPEINKTAIKEAITKDGEVIEGAEVVQTESLRIR